ncbi:MAG: hypothetical protein VXZ72_01745 [Chlamydiota bacterium]|nr:hypothetical protein [Chlamydiota bacterium]
MDIFLASFPTSPGALYRHRDQILEAVAEARQSQRDILLFPGGALAGPHPGNLLNHPAFLEGVQLILEEVAMASKGLITLLPAPRVSPYPGKGGVLETLFHLSEGVVRELSSQQVVRGEINRVAGEEQGVVWQVGSYRTACFLGEDILPAGGYWQGEADTLTPYLGQSIDWILHVGTHSLEGGGGERWQKAASLVARQLQAPLLSWNGWGWSDHRYYPGGGWLFDAEGRGEALSPGLGSVSTMSNSHPLFSGHIEQALQTYLDLMHAEGIEISGEDPVLQALVPSNQGGDSPLLLIPSRSAALAMGGEKGPFPTRAFSPFGDLTYLEYSSLAGELGVHPQPPLEFMVPGVRGRIDEVTIDRLLDSFFRLALPIEEIADHQGLPYRLVYGVISHAQAAHVTSLAPRLCLKGRSSLPAMQGWLPPLATLEGGVIQ